MPETENIAVFSNTHVGHVADVQLTRRYTTALAIGEGLSGSAAGVLGMLQMPGQALELPDTF